LSVSATSRSSWSTKPRNRRSARSCRLKPDLSNAQPTVSSAAFFCHEILQSLTLVGKCQMQI
jgi:hypothetical protein